MEILNSVDGLKVWQMNDMEIWVAETKEQAIKDYMEEFGEAGINEYNDIYEVGLDNEIWYSHEPVSKKNPEYETLWKEHGCTMQEAIKKEIAGNPDMRSFAFTCTEW